MPFDADAGFDTDPRRRSRVFLETDGSEYVPDLHHVSEHLVLLSDGSVLAMLRLPGSRSSWRACGRATSAAGS